MRIFNAYAPPIECLETFPAFKEYHMYHCFITVGSSIRPIFVLFDENCLKIIQGNIATEGRRF